MNKISALFSVVLITMSSALFGQNITKLKVNGYHAQFANDNTILISSDSYTGLRSVDLNSNKETVLSDARKSGKAIFVDGKVVFGDNTSATSMSIDGKELKVIKKDRNVSLQEAAFKIHPNLSKKEGHQLISANSINKLTAIELIYADGTKKIIKPLGKDAQYLQTKISPNGKFILVKQYGGNGYLMSNKGEMIVDLGYMENPNWAGNENIVFQVTKDNGDIITTSDIYKIGISSRVKKNLTEKFSKIAMYPASNSDGSKIIFNTGDGEVYMITK